jgi:hypothetical protein
MAEGEKKRRGERISLHPLTVEEALKVMLDTPPPPERQEAKERARKRKQDQGASEG